MANFFYKVVLNGACQGQDIKNILYYRAGLGADLSGFPFAGAEALAANIKQEVWPTMKAAMVNDYTLESIDVSPINDEFELVYQMPYSLPVNEQGARAEEHTGPATCAVIKFMLEPTSIVNGIKPPSRGYIAVGPVPSAWAQESGFLINAVMASDAYYGALGVKLSENIEQLVPVPQTWYPIRLKQTRVLGGLIHWESYADIKGAQVSRRVSFRRSRMPEA